MGYSEFSHAFLFVSNLNCQIDQNLILEEITSKAFNRQWYKQIISLFIHPNNIYFHPNDFYLHILISWLIASIVFVLKSWQDSDFVDFFEDASLNALTKEKKTSKVNYRVSHIEVWKVIHLWWVEGSIISLNYDS